MSKRQSRFIIRENEGSFFSELWLLDTKTGKDYRYDRVPPEIKKLYATALKEAGKMTADDAAMIISFIIHG